MHGSMRNLLKFNMTVITPTVDVYFWAGIWPNVIRLSPHSFRQVEPLARMMMDLGKTNTIILHRNDNVERDFVHGYPLENLIGFIEEYEALGGNVTQVVPYPSEFWQPGLDGYMMENERYLGEAEAAVQDTKGPGETVVLLVDYLAWRSARSVIEAGTSNATALREAIMMVASNYTGAIGSCAIDDTYFRAVADYQIWGYFATEEGLKRPACGLYNSTSKEITWDPFFTSSEG